MWSFSEILESVCVLPQLLLLRQTTVPTVIDSFYLLTLGSYRAFYIGNWIVRAADPEDVPGRSHPISIIFGVIQTALYVDFAWVYWSRQRVKLRGGGVVDSDDLRKGWLVSRILGRKSMDVDEEATEPLNEDGTEPAPARSGGRWGSRGISVSADEGVLESPKKQAAAPVQSQTRDDELAGILEDDDDDDDDDGDDGVLPTPGHGNGAIEGVSGGQEWREGSGK